STAPAPTDIYTLSLHDALPISVDAAGVGSSAVAGANALDGVDNTVMGTASGGGETTIANNTATGSENLFTADAAGAGSTATIDRSEEHTSELQSRENLVCRLLL